MQWGIPSRPASGVATGTNCYRGPIIRRTIVLVSRSNRECPVRKIVSVLCLSPSVREVVRDAVEALNRCQDLFAFQAIADVVTLPPPDVSFNYRRAPDHVPTADPTIRDGYSWNLLSSLLAREARERGASYLVGVLDRPIENNWFSWVEHPWKIGFVTLAGWEHLSALPAEAFLAYELAELFGEMLVGQLIYHDDTRGCIHDLCAVKADIALKIRTADICHECRDVFLRHLS